MNQSPAYKTCDVCRHWDNDGMSPYGVCRKNPPTGSGWPRVSRKDWCGEWDTWVALPKFNFDQAKAYAESNGLPPPYEPVINPLPPYETVEATVEKRRPGRPRKETA
jgi:hypothetical protein